MARKSRRRMKRRKSRKSRRRRRGGTSAFANITTSKDLVNLFYKPPPMAQPNKTANGFGKTTWESQWVTLAQEISCYMGNMTAHKMSRDAYITKGKGFMMNPKKRQASWDKCKNNAKAPKDWQPLALKYFMKHGFTGPKYVKPAVNFVKIGMSKLPNGHDIVNKLMKEKQSSMHSGMKYGGRKSRRRKKSKKRKRTRRRR